MRVEFYKDLIVNVSCGFNHCVALTEDGKVYVWGKRMGIYPNVELTYDYLKSPLNFLTQEIN